MKYLPGINIQYPISSLILNNKKTIETREYNLPKKYLRKELAIIETPGKNGSFKARIVGIIIFEETFLYKSKADFYKDYKTHRVDKNSDWAWKNKNKWGWKLRIKEIFKKPKPAPERKGIVFTKNALAI